MFRKFWTPKPAIDDPRTETTTSTAQRESIHSSTEYATIFDNNNGTATFSSTQQTIVHQQCVGETIRITRYIATEEEKQEMLRMGGQTMTNLSSNTPSSPTIIRTEETTVKQNGGRTLTTHTEQQNVRFCTKDDLRSGFKNTDAKTTTTTTKTPPKSYVSPFTNRSFAIQAAPKSTASGANSALGKSFASDAKLMHSPERTAASSSTPSLGRNYPPIQPINETVAAPPSKLKPGVAYILNHENFLKTDTRLGSNQDVKSLEKVFKKYKLEIQVNNDPTKKKVKDIGEKIRKRDFSKNSCVVVVILSHGGRHESVLTYEGASYNIDDELLFPMQENKTLKDKPKIFFVQTCKGDLEVSTDGAQNKLVTDAKPIAELNVPREILKCYSTFEGYVSYRHKDGSFFIQELCKLLDEQGKTVDIVRIMDQVRKNVLAKTKTQVPANTSSLTKNYCFGDYCN